MQKTLSSRYDAYDRLFFFLERHAVLRRHDTYPDLEEESCLHSLFIHMASVRYAWRGIAWLGGTLS